jgi:Tol biopolymer transport system component
MRRHETRRIRTAIFTALVLTITTGFLSAQRGADPETRFRDAQRKQEAEGDLNAAIEIYREIADSPAGSRALKARALLQLATALETQGQQAEAVYQRIVKEFADQPAAVPARTKLEALTALNAPSSIKIATPYTDDLFSFAISPDGRSLVFQATAADGKKQLWLQPVDPAKKPTPIAGTEGAGLHAFPFFSPDGRSIGFFADGKLKRVDVAGGVARELAPAPSFRGGTWNKDGVIVFGDGSNVLYRIPATGGQPEAVTSPSFPSGQHFPKFLPDGRHFLFALVRLGSSSPALMMGSLDAAGEKPVEPADAQTAVPGSQGQLLYVIGGELRSQRLDPQKLQTVGDPVRVEARVALNSTWLGVAALAAADAGPVAYRAAAAMPRQFEWFDRTGQRTGILGTPDEASPRAARLSPDGRFVAYTRSASSPVGSVWMIDTAGGASRQLSGIANSGVWSPDSEHIILAQQREGVRMGLFERPLATPAGGKYLGPGQTREILSAYDWSANGFLLYGRAASLATASVLDLMVVPVNGGAPVAVAQTPADERNGRFSPNGHFVAYESNEVGGQYEIYVQPFPGPASARQKLSINGGTRPAWGRNGQELYYLAPDNRLMVAAVSPLSNDQAIEFAQPRPLFDKPLRQGAEYDVTADGERFLINAPVEDAPPIIVLSNWPRAK